MGKIGIGEIRKALTQCPEFEGEWGEEGNCTLYTREPKSRGYTPPPNTRCTLVDQKDFSDFHPGLEGTQPGPLYHKGFITPRETEIEQRLDNCRCNWVSMHSGDRRRHGEQKTRRFSLKNLLTR